jgi:hypothetical protein
MHALVWDTGICKETVGLAEWNVVNKVVKLRQYVMHAITVWVQICWQRLKLDGHIVEGWQYINEIGS